MTPTDQSTADLWAAIVGTTYAESVIDYGNTNSAHGPECDEHLPEDRETARYRAITALSLTTGVPVYTISRLASDAAYNHGFAPDADWHDYLAEPDWDAVRDGTYEPRDPWHDEPDEDEGTDDMPPDEYHVRVWGSRRFWLIGRWGWRVQVDYLGMWDECGDWPLLSERQNWFPTQDEAVNHGLTQARGIHDDGLRGIWPIVLQGCDYTPGPLVVHAGGRVVIDERPEATQ